MRMKSFAVLAISGLLAASTVYIAPVMAEDAAAPDAQTLQAPGDVGNTPQNNPTPNIGGIAQTDNMNVDNGNSDSMSNTDNNASTNPDSNNNSATNPDANAVTNAPSGSTPPSSNDQGAPDTATGDDDY